MNTNRSKPVFFAILAAALYALSTPLSKYLLSSVAPTMMAALLYLGAGLGMSVILLLQRKNGSGAEQPLERADLPDTAAMVALDIAAPILLMLGLSTASAATVSLLNNFEIVATSLIALLLFGERISGRLWVAIVLVTAASAILTGGGADGSTFSPGAVLVLLACVCWGFENNCTRRLSGKNPVQIVAVKGIFSGLGSLLISLVLGERLPSWLLAAAALAVGFVAYGLSIFFYIRAQRQLGAAKTSTWYAVSPFIGAALSLAISRTLPPLSFWIALVIMLAGTYFAASDARTGQSK